MDIQIVELVKELIKPEMLIMIPVLYLIGIGVKNTTLIKDNYIPIALGFIGIVLAFIWLMATSSIKGQQEIFAVIFVAITQGILCAGTSVYFNQILKQSKKEEGK